MKERFVKSVIYVFVLVLFFSSLMWALRPDPEPIPEPGLLTTYENISFLSPVERVPVVIELPPDEAWDRDNLEVMCLGLNIYHEARGSSLEDQVGTALVVMNRVASERFPNTVCGVVWQSAQFSWTNDGRSDRTHELAAYEQSMMIAVYVWNGFYPDFTHGATHYHTREINPSWGRFGYEQISIGSHIYMKVRDR